MPFMRAGKLKLEILNDPSEGRSRFIPYPQPHDNKQNLVRYRRSCLRGNTHACPGRAAAEHKIVRWAQKQPLFQLESATSG